MNTRTMSLIGILAFAEQAAGACVADGPVASARWIYTNQSGFSTYQFPQDRTLMARFLSPGLLRLLEVEWSCQVVSEGSCAVDTNSWTNMQDGRALNPATFSLASMTGVRATVRAQFRFESARAPQPIRARATLVLVKDDKSGCWLLDDLVGMQGQSLVQQLRSYAASYP